MRALSHLDAFEISPNVKQALEELWFGLFTGLAGQEGFLALNIGSAGKMSWALRCFRIWECGPNHPNVLFLAHPMAESAPSFSCQDPP